MARRQRTAEIKDAIEWFMAQDEATRRNALAELFEFAIVGEYVGVWSPGDRKELAAAEGRPVEYFEAPYFRNTGEPLGSPKYLRKD